MSRSTISGHRLGKMFSNEEAARRYLEKRRWPDGVACPFCDESRRIGARKNGFYRCNACKRDFTVRTETVFERSHVPLDKWITAMRFLVSARASLSSLQLAKEIGVTQKTAWFIQGRLREAVGNPAILQAAATGAVHVAEKRRARTSTANSHAKIRNFVETASAIDIRKHGERERLDVDYKHQKKDRKTAGTMRSKRREPIA
ncbi:MAG TPA: IS1595 family transposase [Rhizomicrobium sp.]|nr:IS1595 family transposase [Rhizomicrobium sp.]